MSAKKDDNWLGKQIDSAVADIASQDAKTERQNKRRHQVALLGKILLLLIIGLGTTAYFQQDKVTTWLDQRGIELPEFVENILEKNKDNNDGAGMAGAKVKKDNKKKESTWAKGLAGTVGKAQTASDLANKRIETANEIINE